MKADSHVYSVAEWLRSYEVGERGSNVITKEDKEFAAKLWEVFQLLLPEVCKTVKELTTLHGSLQTNVIEQSVGTKT